MVLGRLAGPGTVTAGANVAPVRNIGASVQPVRAAAAPGGAVVPPGVLLRRQRLRLRRFCPRMS